MGGGGQQTDRIAGTNGRFGTYTWEEVQKHTKSGDQWIVVERKVYNVSQWVKRHPGGLRIIGHYAGEDATDAFHAFHPNIQLVRKYMKPLLIGELEASEPSQDRQKNGALVEDFRALRERLEAEGCFKTQPLFFILHLGHILLLEAIALMLLWYFGTGWINTAIVSVILATAQAGWLQHDFGHLSVFKNSRWDHLLHKFVIGHLKGASAGWWNHRHFQHHAKPNIFKKDPDVNMLNAFVVGNVQPVEYGVKKIKTLPYNHQHKYFFFIGPPLLIPVYFQFQIIQNMITHGLWVVGYHDCFDSYHVYAAECDFTALSLLFPTMPRHNYWRAAPRVRALCDKYGVKYQEKGLYEAFVDIVRSLEKSGELWLDAYLNK
uniref:Fatty acid desaturase 2 n=1 Tax=Cyprinus carpio carpio TaxID=630221 RepID=A0A9J8CK49_CYPCA